MALRKKEALIALNNRADKMLENGSLTFSHTRLFETFGWLVEDTMYDAMKARKAALHASDNTTSVTKAQPAKKKAKTSATSDVNKIISDLYD